VLLLCLKPIGAGLCLCKGPFLQHGTAQHQKVLMALALVSAALQEYLFSSHMCCNGT
jgi:hypothetical protein